MNFVIMVYHTVVIGDIRWSIPGKSSFHVSKTVYLLSLIALTSCKRNQLGNSDVVKTPHVFNLQGGRGGFKKFAKRVDVRFSMI